MTIKVSSQSNPSSVAGMIASLVRDNEKIELTSVGAGALNQAVKAIAIARGFVAPLGVNLVCIPAFTELEINGENKTALKLILEEM